ncbi:hypothetical protein GPX89_14775 [Nocardia sp. ET3-3]|uniref:Uncharacterized protein n=1 Tax=Nocardia terrae TaxID=2675851 RepID=A0A7K1UVZ5_9NOCA|nr:hypothetical protein [Nocardia terrae]MVU78505.1 hypothetical protein [Nocardia terrae]
MCHHHPRSHARARLGALGPEGEADLDRLEQPVAACLADGTCLHLLAEVPELDGVPQIGTFVTDAVVAARGSDTQESVRWGSRRWGQA